MIIVDVFQKYWNFLPRQPLVLKFTFVVVVTLEAQFVDLSQVMSLCPLFIKYHIIPKYLSEQIPSIQMFVQPYVNLTSYLRVLVRPFPLIFPFISTWLHE